MLRLARDKAKGRRRFGRSSRRWGENLNVDYITRHVSEIEQALGRKKKIILVECQKQVKL